VRLAAMGAERSVNDVQIHSDGNLVFVPAVLADMQEFLGRLLQF